MIFDGNLTDFLSGSQYLLIETICLTETWCEQKNELKNSSYRLPNYIWIYQVLNGHKSGSVSIYAHKSLVFTKENLSMNCGNLEVLVIEIDKVKEKNVIVNHEYKPTNGSIKTFHEYLKVFWDKATISNKNIVLIDDFNLNFLDFYHSHSIKISHWITKGILKSFKQKQH